jgi:hypothetical protein
LKNENLNTSTILKFIGGCTLAWIIFGIGLLSPLTPSEGHPEILDLVLFILTPILLITYTVYRSHNIILFIIAIPQILAIVLISKWLLMDVLAHPLFTN